MDRIYKVLLLSFFLFSLASSPLLKSSEAIDAQKLLEQVDDNLWSNTKFISGRLIVDNGRKIRTLTQDTWMEGIDRSYTHYKSPAREKGNENAQGQRKTLDVHSSNRS